MSISRPRLVIIDTATINHLADKPNDSCSKDLMGILRSGDWIPFITYHVLEEIACHENDSVFQKRFNLLHSFPFAACLNDSQHEAMVCGGSGELRIYEVDFLATHPNATYQEVVDAVRPKVSNGFYSGSQIINENSQWWKFFRENLANRTRRKKAELANLTHFTIGDMKEPIPAKGEVGKMRSKQDASAFAKQQASLLERKIREDGDCRHFNPHVAVEQFVTGVLKSIPQNYGAEEDYIEGWLKQGHVDRTRLPAKARTEDFAYESAFAMWMKDFTKLLVGEKKKLMCSIRKEQLPSWLIWQELNRRIREQPKAEIGNVNDEHIASFGPYVDLINVDKRIADALRQISHKHELLLQVHKRVPEKRGLSGLIEALKKN